MSGVTPSQVSDSLAVAGEALTLVERLADLVRGDNVTRAARLRRQAVNLMESAAKAKRQRRADRLRARARGKLAEAQSLDPLPTAPNGGVSAAST